MNLQTQEAINQLAAQFIEKARAKGIQIENIEVNWTDGRYDAKVRSSPHKPRVPAITPIGDLSEVG